MTFIEFIGFIISLLALIYLSARRAKEERRRRAHPEDYAEEEAREQQAYKELLQKLELPIPPELEDIPSSQASAPPPAQPPRPPVHIKKPFVRPTTGRTVRHGFEFHSDIEDRKRQTAIEQRHIRSQVNLRDNKRFKPAVASESMRVDTTGGAYTLGKHRGYSKARQLLEGLNSPGDIVLLHEIIGKPKSLQPSAPLQGLPWEG